MALKSVAAKIPRLQLPEKFKGTIVERWANYWKGLARDYKGLWRVLHLLHILNVKFLHNFSFLDVAIDSVKKIRAKPVKSSVYASIGALIYGSCKTNPNEQMFVEQFRKAEHQLGLVSPEMQNPSSVNYLKMIERCRNNDTLRITSVGVCSIMWIDDCASSLSTYDAKCEYLKPEWRTFHERIVDVGMWNNWWNLKKLMKNYDVNY